VVTRWVLKLCLLLCVNLNRIKILLFTLIRAFEFDLAVSPEDIGVKPIGVQRPVLLTDPNNPNHMPLLVRHISNWLSSISAPFGFIFKFINVLTEFKTQICMVFCIGKLFIIDKFCKHSR